MGFLETVEGLLSYTTVKVVNIKDWKLGLLHYSVMLIILLYVIVWSIILEKGYQKFGPVIGATSIKMKGNGYYMDNGTRIVWDNEDLVTLAQLNDQVFITTSVLPTYQQKRSICPGETKCEKNQNNNNFTCPVSNGKSLDFGISTGNCFFNQNLNDSFCEIQGWCLPEIDDPSLAFYLNLVENMTAFLKLNVEFPDFDIRRNNLPGDTLTNGLNLFSIYEMLDLAKTNYKEVRDKGAVILGTAEWNCDFDFPKSKCKPKWKFTRLDISSILSPGFNFRYSHYYYLEDNGVLVEHRDLFKVWGTKFIFVNTGTAGKFNVVPLFINLGAGLALLGVSTILADFLALHLWRGKNVIHNAKYYDVEIIENENNEIVGKFENENEDSQEKVVNEQSSLLE